jgi:hypothetical protein
MSEGTQPDFCSHARVEVSRPPGEDNQAAAFRRLRHRDRRRERLVLELDELREVKT